MESHHLRRHLITARVPQDDDLDLGFLARQFALAGGGVKNAAVAAAEAGTPVAMRHLVPAVTRELEKAGRSMVASLFGPYAELVG